MSADRTLDRLAEYALAAGAQPMNPQRGAAVKLRVLDALGCAVAGSTVKTVQAARTALERLGGTGTCTVLGQGKAPVDRATLLNSLMVRVLDFNDTYLGKEICHPSDIMAAAIAVGEAQGRSGEDVVRAIAAGYDVFCSLCDGASLYTRGWDVGFGAIVVAIETGLLLRLDATQMAHAISLATVPQVALRQTRAGAISHWKGMAFGHAAAQGVLAAYLAAAGTTGPDAPFEGLFGFIKQVAGSMELTLDPARDRTGDSTIKLFAVYIFAQGPVELAVDLRPQFGDFAPGDAAAVLHAVDTIDVRTHAIGVSSGAEGPGKWAPSTHETADHSIPFLSALALGYGTVRPHDIARGLADPSILELTRKVSVVEDPDHTARFPEFSPARMRVTGRGKSVEAALDAPLGHVTRPVPLERVQTKFAGNAEPVVGAERAAAFERAILALEHRPRVAGLLEI